MSEIFHLRRLHIPKIEDDLSIADGQHHYIKNVMRMKEGDQLRLFNAEQGEFLFEIEALGKNKTKVSKREKLKEAEELARKIILAAPILEKTRMRWMLEKATELGMTHYQPIKTERSELTKFNEEKSLAHMIEAAEQCERLDIPEILPIKTVQQLSGTVLVASERDENTQILKDYTLKSDVTLLIGPPGGVTEEEKNYFLEKENFTAVSLGKNILRTETAALSILIKLL